jgi:glucose/arabinose dehydrogenase
MSKGLLPNVKFIFATILICHSFLSSPQPVVSYNPFITGLSLPVDIVNAGDGTNRLFIVEQRGLIKIHDGSTLLSTPFLDLTAATVPGFLSAGSEQGLLSLAFHPNYENPASRFFFIYYTNGAGEITVARYQPSAGNPNIANPTGVVLLTIDKDFANHNGGKLNFGSDGYLYFGTGDGGSANDPGNNAQNGNSLLGKMLRIDVNNFALSGYEIPPTNPFLAVGDGIRDEIWALGLRNPWRWSFDSQTGDMFIGDVGQGAWEEVDYRAAPNTGGINYGWRCFEGDHVNGAVPACTPSGVYVPPVFEYQHNPEGGQSIVGGIVYRGTNPANAAMFGYYIFNDTYNSNTWLMNMNAPGFATTRQPGLPNGISSYGVDESGELYVASLFSNTIYRVMVTGVLPIQLVSFSGNAFSGYNDLKWKTAAEQDVIRFVIEYSINGRDYYPAGELSPANDPNGHNYTFRHYINFNGKIFYRLKIEEANGTDIYSAVIILNNLNTSPVKVYPSIVTDGQLQVVSEKPVNKYSVYNSLGSLIVSKDINGERGYFRVAVPKTGSGVYWIRMEGSGWTETYKFIVH